MKAYQLRLKLVKLLTKELGKYSNGIPSIWVYGSGKKPPSSSDGLEVLINNMPGGQAAQAASGGIKYKPQIWEVTLKNFKEDRSLVRAIGKIEVNFNVRNYNHLPADEQIIEQAKVYIFDPIGVF
ncbi:MAG: hypothetical protein V7L23_15255 [Nostoc sp.]|uniref:hypothetical protein n=1 Tax=Nostoc sp. TaxID=1180 RepID=UPI002FF04D3A